MSAITTISDLEIDDPGCVHHIREHLASGCPLEPLVEAVAPMPPEERAPLVAAMVAKANTLIAARNEAANDAQFPDMSRNSEDAPKRGRGRPKSEVASERREIASKAGVNERTIRRDAAKLAPPEPAEVIVPKPPKPVPIETLILEFADKLASLAEEGDALLPKALAEPGKATGATWRGSLRMTMANLSKEVSCLRVAADEIKRGRGALAMNDEKSVKAARREEEKAARIASGGGLQAPKKGKRIQVVDEEDRPLLPSVQETANAWADAARAGVGPSEDDDAF
jgi:hypothetical protein